MSLSVVRSPGAVAMVSHVEVTYAVAMPFHIEVTRCGCHGVSNLWSYGAVAMVSHVGAPGDVGRLMWIQLPEADRQIIMCVLLQENNSSSQQQRLQAEVRSLY